MNFVKMLLALITATVLFNPVIAHAWTIKMDFNEGPLGQTVEDKGNGYDVFSDAAGATVYSDCADIPRAGPGAGHCAKMNIQKGHDGWGVWGGRVNFNERGVSNLLPGSEVWISVKIFMPLDFDYTATPHLKFLRLHTRSPAGNEGHNDLYINQKGSSTPFFFIKEQQDLKKLVGKKDLDQPKLGNWETYEIYLKMDHRSVADGGTSRVRIWKEGKLLADLDQIQTLKTADSYADAFLIFTYWNGGNPSKTGEVPTKDQELYIDDLIVTTDTPISRDSDGNPMIGDMVMKPNSPTHLVIN